MKITNTKLKMFCAAVAAGFAALSAGTATAQTANAPGMVWLDLNKLNAPLVLPQRDLWSREIAAAQKNWSMDGDKSAVSAFTLSRSFKDATPPVFVSIFSAGFECERTGDSGGENLYVKCPTKIVTGTPANPRIKVVPSVCQLWIQLEPGEVEGPRPDKNYTTVTMDKGRVLRFKTVQYGKHVRECDLTVAAD